MTNPRDYFQDDYYEDRLAITDADFEAKPSMTHQRLTAEEVAAIRKRNRDRFTLEAEDVKSLLADREGLVADLETVIHAYRRANTSVNVFQLETDADQVDDIAERLKESR